MQLRISFPLLVLKLQSRMPDAFIIRYPDPDCYPAVRIFLHPQQANDRGAGAWYTDGSIIIFGGIIMKYLHDPFIGEERHG